MSLKANRQLSRHSFNTALTAANDNFPCRLVSNRLTQVAGSTSTTYGYTSGSNRLKSIGSQTVTTNANGSITGFSPALNNVASLTYNNAGRLSATKSASATLATYTYDAFGHRTVKTTGSTGEIYIYDPWGHLLEETNQSGVQLADYVYVDDLPMAQWSKATGHTTYLHSNHLGTPQTGTDYTWQTNWQATYAPFGATVGTVISSDSYGAVTQNLRLPGQYGDAESGFNYNGFRDYAPMLGRYLESDPIGLAGGMNTYGYVGQNPLTGSDPLGLGELILFKSGSTAAQVAVSDETAGSYTVDGHGSSQNIEDQTVDPSQYTSGYSGQLLTAQQIADLITSGAQGSQWTPGEPILLYACNTGQGDNSLAQQLANILQTSVTAPNNVAQMQYGYPDGSSYPTFTNFVVSNSGSMITFTPIK